MNISNLDFVNDIQGKSVSGGGRVLGEAFADEIAWQLDEEKGTAYDSHSFDRQGVTFASMNATSKGQGESYSSTWIEFTSD